MQGTLFTGKITVRFDKDGIPTTRGPGDMTSDYKKSYRGRSEECGCRDRSVDALNVKSYLSILKIIVSRLALGGIDNTLTTALG